MEQLCVGRLRVAANDLNLWSLPAGQTCFLAPWHYQSGWGCRISKEERVWVNCKPSSAALSPALPRSFPKTMKTSWHLMVLVNPFS